MAKLLIDKTYGIAPNCLLNDESISLKAKGLFTYMQSKKDDWNFSITGISSQCLEGVEAIASGLRELEAAGYLIRTRIKDNNKFVDIEYTLYESPQTKDFPRAGEPSVGDPISGDRHDISKQDLSKQDKSKKEINIPFDDFWSAYNHKIGKRKASLNWNKLSPEEQALAIKDAPIYKASLPSWRQPKDPATYLHQKCWEDDRDEAPEIKEEVHVNSSSRKIII